MTRATSIIHSHNEPTDTITLSYDDRHRRRMAMTADNGLAFLLDLAETTQLRHGDDLLLEDGRHVRVIAASEQLMQATCNNARHLTRTAWHIGNRHLPCEIHSDKLVLRFDHVIAQMLEQLDCTVTKITAPFNPQGGAYGHGRTHGHDSGHGHD